jgi:hypothetical protein
MRDARDAGARGFGASAEVVEPAWLRERVAGELGTAAARYV